MAAALPTHRMDYGSRSIICLSKEYKRQIRESRLLWNVVYVFTEPKCVAIVSRPQSWLMKTVAKKRSARICNKFSRPRAKKKAKSYKILCFHHHLKIRPHRESPHPAHRLGCAGDDFSSFRSYWERKRSGRTRTGRTTATYTDTHKILEERRTMQKTIGRETYPVALDQLAVCQRDVVAAAAGRWRRKPPLPDPSPLWSLDLLSQISIGTWPFGIGRQNRADGAQGERQHGDRQLSAQSCKLLGMEIFLKKKEKEEETKERRVSGLVSSTTGTKLSVERQ